MAMQHVINRTMPSQQTIIVTQTQNISMSSLMMSNPTLQSTIAQGSQQYLVTGQAPGNPQPMVMQQFQLQRQVVPTAAQQQRCVLTTWLQFYVFVKFLGCSRFSAPNMQQRFQSVANQSQAEAKPTAAKKPKRRRSSTKAKAKASSELSIGYLLWTEYNLHTAEFWYLYNQLGHHMVVLSRLS